MDTQPGLRIFRIIKDHETVDKSKIIFLTRQYNINSCKPTQKHNHRKPLTEPDETTCKIANMPLMEISFDDYKNLTTKRDDIFVGSIINDGEDDYDKDAINLYNAELKKNKGLERQIARNNNKYSNDFVAVWYVLYKNVVAVVARIINNIQEEQIIDIQTKTPVNTYSVTDIGGGHRFVNKDSGFEIPGGGVDIGGKRVKPRKSRQSRKPRKQHNKKTRKHSRK